MKMQGEKLIQAPQQDVWKALNDPDVLKQCIPGCEEMRKVSDHGFSARVKAKVGPVSLTMTGDVQLSDLNPPVSYRITGQGKGGAAGFAKGDADIRLADQGGATLISYDVDAQVGGKLAQIGNRLIDSTARKMADDFFSRFVAIVESGEKAGASPAIPSGGSPEPLASPIPPSHASASIAMTAARDAERARRDAQDDEPSEPTNQSGHLVLWLILIAVALAVIYYLFFRN
ncbi:MAG: carbon monoxide dehydrogenase subunit G [Aestuariivirgaceae bacterium]